MDLQNLYLAHGVTALLAVLFATLHVNDSQVGGFAKTIGDMAWYLSISITALALVYLTSQVEQFLPILKKPIDIVKQISQRFFFTREINVWIHLLAPLIVIFIFIHVLCIDSYRSDTTFMIIFTLYFAVFVVLYLYYGIYKEVHVSRYRVQKVTPLNKQTYELSLQYCGGAKLRYKCNPHILHQQGVSNRSIVTEGFIF